MADLKIGHVQQKSAAGQFVCTKMRCGALVQGARWLEVEFFLVELSPRQTGLRQGHCRGGREPGGRAYVDVAGCKIRDHGS
jgi:hypothetical protein